MAETCSSCSSPFAGDGIADRYPGYNGTSICRACWNNAAALDAEKFINGWTKNFGYPCLKKDVVAMSKAFALRALDVAINTFDAMPGMPINVNEVINILQGIRDGVK